MGSGKRNTHPGPSRVLSQLSPIDGGVVTAILSLASSRSGVDSDGSSAGPACRPNEAG